MIPEKAPDSRFQRRPLVPYGRLRPTEMECRGASAAFAELDRAVHGVLSNGWEDSRRRPACELSSALLEATRKAGWEDASSTLASLTSLLAISMENGLFPHAQFRDQILGLLIRLTQIAREPAAGLQER